MVSLALQHEPLRSLSAECAVWFLPGGTRLTHELRGLEKEFPECARALRRASFKGHFQETLLLFPRTGGVPRLLVVGLGPLSQLTAERLRRAATTGIRSAEAQHSSSVTLLEPPATLVPAGFTGGQDAVAYALLEGAVLAAYRYDTYRTRERKKDKPVSRISFRVATASRTLALRKVLREVTTVCSSTWLARDLENAPGNALYPITLARKAVAAGRKSGFTVRVLGTPQLRKLRMGGLLAVSAGSQQPPRLIVMEYRRGRATRKPVVLIGKGVTFDSGGISIKPSASMAEMKMDMSGAAAVLGTMQAVASLRLPLHLVGIIPATENLPSGSALKPGDIITHFNGLTSEVDNTDAEGRLILADTLAFAGRYHPEVIIDLATLTGAVVVALGSVTTGMMGNDQQTMNELLRSGERTYERVWQLPLFEEYERLIKSDIADMKNVGGKWAGAITGAMFLKQFVGKHHWVHLDIAGTAMMEDPFEYIPKGGSGVGVRLLVDFLRTHAVQNRD
jgi:leucyl aminopeptidase